MKIEIVKEKLQPILVRLERITGKHLSLPILSCFSFLIKKGVVVIRATNLELGVEYTIPAKTEGEGLVTIPAAPLSSFVSNLPSGSSRGVTFEIKEGKFFVFTASARAQINTAPSGDFPIIPKAEGVTLKLKPSVFVSGFRSVGYAGAVGSLKQEFGCVFVAPGNDELVYAATDSFRLAEKKLPLKQVPSFPPILVPLRNANELVRFLEDEDNTTDVTVTIEKGQLSVVSDRMRITSRLLEGVFPDYQQIIPKEVTTEAVALKEDLTSALKSTTLFSDRFNQIHLSVDPKKKLFEISAKNGDVGESQAAIGAALTGAAVEGNFNHRYISDCLGVLTSDSISFCWSKEGRPLLIRGVGDGNFRYIVMPMNR